jgi:hypothetical protein
VGARADRRYLRATGDAGRLAITGGEDLGATVD